MIFQLLPVIDIMMDLYKKPRTFNRFQDYLATIEGEKKGEFTIPVGGFNPMAKEYAIGKLEELKELGAEQIINDTLTALNNNLSGVVPSTVFKVSLNLADDLAGGWTNRFTTDYDSKFKTSPLLKRNFCIPVFWTSEHYTASTIAARTLEYCYRTIHALNHPKPATLEEHLLQEVTVARALKSDSTSGTDMRPMESFYETYKHTTVFATIFNFFYGDEAAISIGNNPLGVKDEFAGYAFARWMAGN